MGDRGNLPSASVSDGFIRSALWVNSHSWYLYWNLPWRSKQYFIFIWRWRATYVNLEKKIQINLEKLKGKKFIFFPLLTEPEIALHGTSDDFFFQLSAINLLSRDSTSLSKTLRYVKFERELKNLQIEMIKLQNWVSEKNKKIIILFEGRDSAGKGGAIRRTIQNLNPRKLKVVALPKPSISEEGQWYFQRYVEHFPKNGEIVFFDKNKSLILKRIDLIQLIIVNYNLFIRD